MDRRLFLACALLSFCAASGATTPAELLAQVRTASGAEHWQPLQQIELEGTIVAGRLTGTFNELASLVDARRVSHYDLQVLAGAEGFDGSVIWHASAAGLVDIDESEDGMRQAVSESFLSSRGYLKAQIGSLQPKLRQVKGFAIVSITPPGGNLVELWIDTHSHLIARVDLPVTKQIIRWSDYRRVHGIMLPHRIEWVDSSNNLQVVSVAAYKVSAALDPARLRKPESRLLDTQFAEGQRTLPAYIESGNIFVEVTINDASPALFILDTGAGINVLTPAAAKHLNIAALGDLNATGIGEKQTAMALTRVSKLQVGPVLMHDQEFGIVPLPKLSIWRNGHEDSAAGLLGYQFFRRVRVTIDYDNVNVTLAPLHTCDDLPAQAARLYMDDSHTPRVPLNVAGSETLWELDTGNSGSLIMSGTLAERLGVPLDAGAVVVNRGGVGGHSRERLLRFSELTLGSYQLAAPILAVSDQKSGALAGAGFNGNIGYSLLRNFNLTIDYECRFLALTPSRLYGMVQPSDGAGVRWIPDDAGNWRVLHVIPGSPAAAANLRAGDELVTAGHASGAALTRGFLRALQEQPPGTPVPLTLRRSNQLYAVELRLQDFVPKWQPGNGDIPR